jgi:glycine cleavage system aminomethyltransferase T
MTDELNVISIAGPNAGKTLAKLVGQDVVDGWKFLDAKDIKIDGQVGVE